MIIMVDDNITTMFGIDVMEGDVIGFEKTVAKNSVIIYGEVVSLNSEDRTITISTRGYKGNPSIDKKKFKETYVVPGKKAIMMKTK